MKFLGMGSNVGSRKSNLRNAIDALAKICSIERIAPIYESPALLPKNASSSWNLPYLNTVIQFQTQSSPNDFLSQLQNLESVLGRDNGPKWSPRPIDLDILCWDGLNMESNTLTLPHPELKNRAFVLDPLKDLDHQFLRTARNHPQHAPLWMGIINLTPDSFSDGGHIQSLSDLERRIDQFEEIGVQIIDLGAESTRPNALPITPDAEWKRLARPLKTLLSKYSHHQIKSRISVDTRNALTARRAIDAGAHIINDVSGLSDPEMIQVLKNSSASYVLTHSLTVPADSKACLKSTDDPFETLDRWLKIKLEFLQKNDISLDRIFFDPGIGFGKHALQSLQILKNFSLFKSCPVKTLVGHSRKSCLSGFSPKKSEHRDLETLGVSLSLIQQGVDALRVHDPEMHIRAFRGWSHVTG